MATRDYDGDGVTVHWDSSRCIHTGICLRSLPAVFDREQRPWVNITGADAAQIAVAVGRCPSGALTYTTADGSSEDAPEPPRIVTRPNGPYAIRGYLEVRNAAGEVLSTGPRATLCRCGASDNKPFCDNSHIAIGFEAP